MQNNLYEQHLNGKIKMSEKKNQLNIVHFAFANHQSSTRIFLSSIAPIMWPRLPLTERFVPTPSRLCQSPLRAWKNFIVLKSLCFRCRGLQRDERSSAASCARKIAKRATNWRAMLARGRLCGEMSAWESTVSFSRATRYNLTSSWDTTLYVGAATT